MSRMSSRYACRLGLLLSLLMMVMCTSQPTGPSLSGEHASLLVQARVSATLINTLVVEVTAPDITTPLVFNIIVTDGVATGTVEIPTGSDRTITIRAFDTNGIETHRGSATVDVLEGTNPTVYIVLIPVSGGQPVEVEIGSFSVEVVPAAATVAVGETVQLTATILDANGNPFAGEANWASLQPVVATVDATGLVTAVSEGTAQVVAVFGLVGGSAEITVTEPLPAPPFVYVANHKSDDISVIEIATSTVVNTIGVGDDPYGVAIAPDGAFVYVANHKSGDVSVIDTASNSVVATVGAGAHPKGVAVTPDGAFVYVTNHVSDTVSVIETTGNTLVAAIEVGNEPYAVAFSPDGNFAYVTNHKSRDVSVIATASSSVVATVGVGHSPRGMAVAPDGAFVYVALEKSNHVSVIETAGNTVVATVEVGHSPRGVAVTPDGAHAWVVNHKSDTVTVIDTASNTVRATIDVGADPYSVAISEDGTYAFVTNQKSHTVSVIDTASETVVATISVGSGPRGMAITPQAGSE